MTYSISRRSLLGAALVAAPLSRILADTQQQANTGSAPDRAPDKPIRLIANENPYGPSPTAQLAANQGVSKGWKYAFGEMGALKQQLAARHGVSPDHIIVTAGSGEALKIAALANCQGGGRVVAARPTFTLITDYAESLGCEIDWVPLDDNMTHDLNGMAAAVGDDTRLIYVCNPNNPTGTKLETVDLNNFLDEVSGDAPVVVDEAYLDLQPGGEQQSVIPRVLAGDDVIVTRTFSKIYGMAGMRIGYAIALPEQIDRFDALRMSFISLPGVLAASASLDDEEFLEFSRGNIKQCMAVTTAVLDELNLAYTPSYGNFILFDTGGSADAFKQGMLERGIQTGRPEPTYPGWTRVSMGKVEDMVVFADAARDYFQPA